MISEFATFCLPTAAKLMEETCVFPKAMQAPMQVPLFSSKISVTTGHRPWPQPFFSGTTVASLSQPVGGRGPGGHQWELAGKRTALAIFSLLRIGRKQRCLGSFLAPVVMALIQTCTAAAAT